MSFSQDYINEFKPAFYLNVEFVPSGTVAATDNIALPYDENAFAAYNALRIPTDTAELLTNNVLLSNNSFNLQGLYQTQAAQVILLRVELRAATDPDRYDIQLLELKNLNYQTFSQAQFLIFNTNTLRKLKVPFILFQLSTAQLRTIVSPLPNSQYTSLIVNDSTTQNLPSGQPIQVSQKQWLSYSIPNDKIANFWGTNLYDATQTPSPPARPANALAMVKPVIALISRTSTQIIVQVTFGDNTYYQTELNGVLTVSGDTTPIAGSIIQNSKVIRGIYSVTITGLDPAVTYRYTAGTRLINPFQLGTNVYIDIPPPTL
jgi:hypothetical protein